MSSFLVSEKSIHAIVTTFIRKMPGHKLAANPKELGQMLSNMNVDAFTTRYPSDECDYTKYIHSTVTVSDLSAYKVISCYLYQCSESNELVNRDLYKAIEQLKSILADNLICRIPGFDALERDL